MKQHTTGVRRRLLGGLAALALVATACGSDDDGGDDADDATTTTEAAAAGDDGESDPADETLRVVSLSPTHTEIMFAIGAGDLLVAVDEFSDYPAETAELPNDLSGFEPNVESIASYEPELVLIGGDFTGLGAQLDELGIGWWDGPPASSLDDAYRQITEVGAATGFDEGAAEVVAGMQARVDEIVAESGGAGEGLSFYHEIDATYFSADSTTFIGQIYTLLGLSNIADADESESFGFPQLNAEFIIEQNPDLIFLPTGTFYFETADGVAARPGWDVIAAVQNGDIIETDDEIAGRWGPRIVDYLDEVADAVVATAE